MAASSIDAGVLFLLAVTASLVNGELRSAARKGANTGVS